MTPPDPSPLDGKEQLLLLARRKWQNAELGIPPSRDDQSMGAVIDIHAYIHTGKTFEIIAFLKVVSMVMGCWPVNRKESAGSQLSSLRYARHPVAVTATRYKNR